jgi:serine/threonine protein kinase/WD40 repeat protein
VKVGRYTLGGELGRGGIGVVFRAQDPAGRDVALKIMANTRAGASQRFAREARLHEQLGEASGFVPLLDMGELKEGSYLVMPLLTGGTLRDRLIGGQLPLDEVVALGTRLADALGRAHQAGIVHRDVKPDNVLYTGEGQPLLSDLGLAKHFRQDVSGASQSVALSQTGEMRGTIGYMAPEQLSDATSVGPPADVFALGALLYECLAGAPAFEGDTLMSLMAQIATAQREPLHKLRPDCPSWLLGVVDHALVVDPHRRLPDGAALAAALRSQPRRERRWGGMAFAVLLVLAALGLAFAAQREAPPSDKPSPTPTESASLAPSASPTPSPGLPYPQAFAVLDGGKHARLVGVCPPSSATAALALGVLPDGRPFAVEPQGVHAFQDGGSILIADPKAGVRFRGASVQGWRLATVGRHVRIWDLNDGGPVASIELEAEAEHVALSPDGKQVFFGYQGKVYLGPVALGRSASPTRVGEHAERITDVAAGEPGFVSVGGNSVVALYDTEGRPTVRLEQSEVLVDVAFVPGAQRLLTLDLRGELREWEASGQARWSARVLGSGERARQLALSPEGRQAAVCSEEGVVHLVDLSTRETLHRIDLRQAGESLACMSFAQRGHRLLLGTRGGALVVFDLGTQKKATPVPIVRPRAQASDVRGRQAEDLRGLCALPDGTLVSAGSRRVHLWDPASGELRSQFEVGGELVAVRALSSTRLLTLGGGRSLRVWDLRRDPPLEVLRIGLAYVPLDVSLDPSGRRAAVLGTVGSLELWDLEARERIWSRKPDMARRVLLLEDGRVILGYIGGILRRFDVAGKLEHTRRTGPGRVEALTRYGKGHYLAAGGGMVLEIDPTESSPTWLSGSGGEQVTSFAVHGTRVVVATNLGNIWLLDAGNYGKRLWRLRGDVGLLPVVAMTPDGRALVGGSDRRLTLLDLAKGKERLPYTGHRHSVFGVAFDAGGERVVSGGARSLRTWKIEEGNALRAESRHDAVEFMETQVAGPHAAIVRQRLRPLKAHSSDSGFHLRAWEPSSGRSGDIGLPSVKVIAISGDGAYAFLATGPGEGLLLTLAPRMEEVARFPISSAHSAALSHDGRLVAILHGEGVTVRDARSGRTVREFPRERGAPTFLRSLTGAPLLGFTRQGAVALVDPIGGQALSGVVLYESPLLVHAGPKGQLLTQAAGRGVELWAISPPAPRLAARLDLDDPIDHATALAVSPLGKRIAVGTARGRVLVYDAP